MTSFSSKSELALNRSIDGKSITFMAYHGGPGCGEVSGFSPPHQICLDVSASSTPAACDPTNPVIITTSIIATPFDCSNGVPLPRGRRSGRETATSISPPGNAYSGDNGRAAIKGANGLYYMAGNDNSGNLSKTQLPIIP